MFNLNMLSRGDVTAVVMLMVKGVKVEVLNSSFFNTVKDSGATSLSRASFREASADC